MAFDITLVAIRWLDGKHEVIAEEIFNQGLDWPALKAEYPLYDISDDVTGYVDKGAILPIHRVRALATSDRLKAWLDGPARDASFIFLHDEEWESGTR